LRGDRGEKHGRKGGKPGRKRGENSLPRLQQSSAGTLKNWEEGEIDARRKRDRGGETPGEKEKELAKEEGKCLRRRQRGEGKRVKKRGTV